MNNTYKKTKDLRDILLFCILCGVFFCFFNQHFSENRARTKPEKHHEYVFSQHGSLISENHELKISKPVFRFGSFAELSGVNSQNKREQVQKAVPGKDFSQVKILLKQNSYNLHFASGLHEPPLVA